MPIKKSSIKDVRRTRRRRERNVAVMSRLRGALKAVTAAKTLPEAEKAFKLAEKLLDKASRKGYIHKNQAARRKSRLAGAVKKLKGKAK